MNKAQKFRRYVFLMLVFLCLILFNSGCGLDVVYVIEPPYQKTEFHTPAYNSTSPDDWYFEFMTFEDTYSGVSFSGSQVYYKIYKSYSTMLSESNTLINLSSNNETSANAPDRMIKTYYYQPLRVQGYNTNVLIPTENKNRHVYIRLSDKDPYQAEITVDGMPLYDSTTKTIPVRSNGKVFTFRSGNSDTLPDPDNDKASIDNATGDYNVSGSGTDGTWYICMFAVEEGYDSNFSPVYSNVLYLGAVTITAQ